MPSLGHIINVCGIRPAPQKLTAINNFPVPKEESSLKSFLVVASYYRSIKQFGVDRYRAV